MTYDPRQSARERTPFGDFELHPTHLRTGVVAVTGNTQEEERAAVMQVCAHADDAGQAATMLDMLGLEARR